MEENEIKSISCNNALAPFLRNQYFYGKLLTVRDFENEQSYFIKKQRLINKHIHGEGVVCGLTVEKVKENQIKIKSGIALDCCGREIIVPDDEIINLPGRDNREYWVTLSYSECGKEQVAAAINANSCEESCCFSRIEEGYKIEVFDKKPEICSSFQADNLCKSWKSLEFEEEGSGFHANPNPHPNPYPLDPGFSVNTGVMENIIPRKIHTVSQNSPEEFVKKYQGVCPSEMDKNKPLILAKIGFSGKQVIIDNALVTATGFDKKLVHTNPKLFELLKCERNDEEETFTKIDGLNWEHGKKYLLGAVLDGVAKGGSKNTVILDDDASAEDVYKDMTIVLINKYYGWHMTETISKGISFQFRTITGYEGDKKEVTVDEDWDTAPDDSGNWSYRICQNEEEAFFEKLQRLEIRFDKAMKKESIDAKTLDLIQTDYKIIESNDMQNIEIIDNKMEIPIHFYTEAPDNEVHFGVQELKKHVINQLIRSHEMKKESLGLDKHIATKFGVRILVHLKGDFILDEDGRPIDANHLKGEIPSGNGSAGGLFESWFDFIVDEGSFTLALLETKQIITDESDGIAANAIKEKVRLMPEAIESILDIMNKSNEISLINGKYFPLPDPDKTIIAFDTRHAYLKASAVKLSERLKEKGVSVTLKSVADLTDEDKENHEIILLRGNILDSNTSTKFSDISSKVKWDKSEGEIEIVHKTDRMSSPVFVIGGKNQLSVEKAVENYVKRYSTQ